MKTIKKVKQRKIKANEIPAGLEGAYTMSPKAVSQVKERLNQDVRSAFRSFLEDCRLTIREADQKEDVDNDLKRVAGLLKDQKNRSSNSLLESNSFKEI